MGEYVLEVDEMMEDIFFSVKLKEEGKKKTEEKNNESRYRRMVYQEKSFEKSVFASLRRFFKGL